MEVLRWFQSYAAETPVIMRLRASVELSTTRARSAPGSGSQGPSRASSRGCVGRLATIDAPAANERSIAQVGLLVVPGVMLLSFAFAHPLTLAFRPVELAAMGAAAAFVAVVIRDGRSRRWEGALLVAVYAAMVIAFLFAGDRGG